MDEETKRLDRLYNLLPAVYRLRDVEEGWPLKAFLRVISEQVNALEDDILQLYDNWFIETAQDWVVPYIGDLIGYRPAHTGSEADGGGAAASRILVPRREVANTIGYRRRKGTLTLLEDLARNVAGWPAYAVEFRRFLAWFQNLNHLRFDATHTADLRLGASVDLLGTPIDELTHLADIRTVSSHLSAGYYNLPSVGLFVWRLKSYSVTQSAANSMEEVGPYCYTFNILGTDTPLYTPDQPSGPYVGGPTPITRHAFEHQKERYYGPGKSFAIWAPEWGDIKAGEPIPVEAIVPADLTDWQYRPRPGFVAVDPETGRIVFPPSKLPKRLRVSYYYGFSADIGGGEYDRPLIQPATYRFYRVGEDQPSKRISDALQQWHDDQQAWQQDPMRDSNPALWREREPRNAIIEIADSAVYVDQLDITVGPRQSLQIRAANRARPTIALVNWRPDMPDALTITLAPSGHCTLDGLLIAGRPVHFRAAPPPAEGEEASPAGCPPQITIRHCTLVPGWALDEEAEPKRPSEPSLEVFELPARITIEHSILGSIQLHLDPTTTEPLPLEITDSILDGMSNENEALGAPGYDVAHAILAIKRSTVLGIMDVHAIRLAENCIFNNCLNVARRQLGCMRFCYVPHGCRTPRRYSCQPDLAAQAAVDDLGTKATQEDTDAERERAYVRVQPQFNAVRYGRPDYCQLAESCPPEISQGADDESEIGAFHDLFQPQRTANLAAALDVYTPAEMEAGIIFAS
jgi:hypothetical protein